MEADCDLPDTGITDEQLSWMMGKLATWVIDVTKGEAGSFRTLVEHLGSDYSTLYRAGGMNFTNAVFDLQSPYFEPATRPPSAR